MLNIALFSPGKNPYSETFIQAHKNYLKGKVYYYYGLKETIQLEGSKRLVSLYKLRYFSFLRKLNKYPLVYIKERSLLASLKKNAIDVVLVEYGTHAYNLRQVLAVSGLPVVTIFHGYDASVKAVIEQCKNYRDVFSLSSKIVAVSKVMMDKLIALGCPRNKIIHTPCAPDYDFENVQPKYTKKQFLAIGRFTDKKAPYYTIMAFKEVLSKHPDAKLVFAGDGALLNMCKNLVKYHQLENHVQFLGVISSDTYRQLLSESLGLVQHSITAENGDMEGTPVAILEASAAGLPVIATRHAGIPDVIIHQKTGLLCEEHDVKTMANHMIMLLDDKKLAEEMGAFGKKHILENFSMKHHIQKLQNVLEEVLKTSKI